MYFLNSSLNKKRKAQKVNSFIILSFFTLLLIVGAFTGCSDNSTSPASSSSKVEGKVTDNNGFNKASKINSNVEGAVVTLAKINADGSLQTVSNASVKTDVNGKFDVETDLDGVSNLVVVAVKNNTEWRAVVTSQVKSGTTVYSQPLNDETTVEADVYFKSKAKNYNDVNYSRVANYINASIAAQLKNDENLKEELAASFHAEAQAEMNAISNTEIGGSQADLNAIINARSTAQANLESDLNNSASQSQIDAAFQTYNEAAVNAYSNTTIKAEAYAKLLVIAHRAFINSVSNMNAQIKLELIKRSSFIRAKIVAKAIEAKFIALGASNAVMTNVINAGVSLSASVKSAGSINEIDSAFDTYHSAIISYFQTAAQVDANQSSTIESSVAGFKASLKTEIAASISADVIINAYINFYSRVKGEVKTVLNSAADTKVNASAAIFILANIHY